VCSSSQARLVCMYVLAGKQPPYSSCNDAMPLGARPTRHAACRPSGLHHPHPTPPGPPPSPAGALNIICNFAELVVQEMERDKVGPCTACTVLLQYCVPHVLPAGLQCSAVLHCVKARRCSVAGRGGFGCWLGQGKGQGQGVWSHRPRTLASLRGMRPASIRPPTPNHQPPCPTHLAQAREKAQQSKVETALSARGHMGGCRHLPLWLLAPVLPSYLLAPVLCAVAAGHARPLGVLQPAAATDVPVPEAAAASGCKATAFHPASTPILHQCTHRLPFTFPAHRAALQPTRMPGPDPLLACLLPNICHTDPWLCFPAQLMPCSPAVLPPWPCSACPVMLPGGCDAVQRGGGGLVHPLRQRQLVQRHRCGGR